MPDVSLCQNVQCPLRFMCYRFTAKPDPYWQAYSDFKPINGVCEYFWTNNTRK